MCSLYGAAAKKIQGAFLKNMRNIFLKPMLAGIFALFFTGLLPLQFVQAQSNPVLDSLLQSDNTFLPADQAFRFNAVQQGQQLVLSWNIADGYYLYQDKIKLAATNASFTEPDYPPATETEDEFFGLSTVYYQQLTLTVPLQQIGDNGRFHVQYIGCAEAGLCYPPVSRQIELNPVADTPLQTEIPQSGQFKLAERLKNDSVLVTLLIFFLLGTGLAFTPCVFPMYPILSSIIVGPGKALSGRRAFGLSLAYVQGMAITYSLLGLVIASLGLKFQAYMQHPAVLITVSLLFVLLAIAMFGRFNLTLPARWQQKLHALSNKQQGGSVKGAFIMGALSGLIASPCTTAPLSAALLYVAQSGDLLFGALALYILSLGMGLPLLLLGSFGAALLPKSGNWMNVVKTGFGFLLLAVPLILLERILPFWSILLLATLLILLVVLYLYRLVFQLQHLTSKAVLLLLAQLLVIALAWWHLRYWSVPVTPLLPVNASIQQNAQGFIEVTTFDELTKQIKLAAQQQQLTMVDLYADWCIACKEFEQFTFADPQVQVYFQQMRLIKIDVTRMSREHQQLLDHYQVMGLPTLLFFSAEGTELTSARVTGFMAAAPFSAYLQQLLP